MSRIFLTVGLLILAGCASKSATNPDSFEFARPYVHEYDGKRTILDPEKDIVLFTASGDGGFLEPLLAVVDGSFVLARIADLDFEKFNGTNILRVTGFDGTEYPQDPPLEIKRFRARQTYFNGVTKASDCLRDLFRANGYLYSNTVYANKRFPVKVQKNYHHCAITPQAGGDTGISFGCDGYPEWTTDLNQNGIEETWVAFSNGGFQVWENFESHNKVLIIDSARMWSQINSNARITPDETCHQQ